MTEEQSGWRWFFSSRWWVVFGVTLVVAPVLGALLIINADLSFLTEPNKPYTFQPLIAGYIRSKNRVYTDALRGAVTWTFQQDIETLPIGQSYNKKDGWIIYHAYFSFNTTGIPKNATVKDAKLLLWGKSLAEFNFTIIVQNWTGKGALSREDFNEVGNATLGNFSTVNWKNDNYNEIALNETAISKGGITGLVLLSTRTQPCYWKELVLVDLNHPVKLSVEYEVENA